MKKKASELTKLYEYDPEDDKDPYYELYNCQKMTFLEQVLSEPMNILKRVEIKPTNSAFTLKSLDDYSNEESKLTSKIDL